MKTFALEIPEEMLVSVKIPRNRWKPDLKRELALQLYRENMISFANAHRLAGMTKIEFHSLPGERHDNVLMNTNPILYETLAFP